MKNLWNIIQRIPPAFAAAVAVGVGILLLIMRGRRLEAELAQTKLKEQTAKSRIHVAKNWAARVIYEKQATEAAAEAKELELEAVALDANGAKERNRIENLSDKETHQEYLKLVKRAKERARK